MAQKLAFDLNLLYHDQEATMETARTGLLIETKIVKSTHDMVSFVVADGLLFQAQMHDIFDDGPELTDSSLTELTSLVLSLNGGSAGTIGVAAIPFDTILAHNMTVLNLAPPHVYG